MGWSFLELLLDFWGFVELQTITNETYRLACLAPGPTICASLRGSLPGRYRPDPLFVGRYEGRYQVVIGSLPPDRECVGRYQVVTTPTHYL